MHLTLIFFLQLKCEDFYGKKDATPDVALGQIAIFIKLRRVVKRY